MLKQLGFVKKLSQRRFHAIRSFSDSSVPIIPSPIIELRQCDLIPEKALDFVALNKELYDSGFNILPLKLYSTCEIGSNVNQVSHVYVYNSIRERDDKRLEVRFYFDLLSSLFCAVYAISWIYELLEKSTIVHSAATLFSFRRSNSIALKRSDSISSPSRLHAKKLPVSMEWATEESFWSFRTSPLQAAIFRSRRLGDQFFWDLFQGSFAIPSCFRLSFGHKTIILQK